MQAVIDLTDCPEYGELLDLILFDLERDIHGLMAGSSGVQPQLFHGQWIARMEVSEYPEMECIFRPDRGQRRGYRVSPQWGYRLRVNREDINDSYIGPWNTYATKIECYQAIVVRLSQFERDAY